MLFLDLWLYLLYLEILLAALLSSLSSLWLETAEEFLVVRFDLPELLRLLSSDPVFLPLSADFLLDDLPLFEDLVVLDDNLDGLLFGVK